MAVGEVAPAVAGGQQLAAYPALPLQQRHPVPGVGESRQRRHQAGGPAADDADPPMFSCGSFQADAVFHVPQIIYPI